ncbi:hypothetical protein ACJ41O_010748 [Fusarium nematophilum]
MVQVNEEEIYLALRPYFKGPNRFLRRFTKVEAIIEQNKDDDKVRTLLRKNSMDQVCQATCGLLKNGIFQSPEKAEMRFRKPAPVRPRETWTLANGEPGSPFELSAKTEKRLRAQSLEQTESVKQPTQAEVPEPTRAQSPERAQTQKPGRSRRRPRSPKQKLQAEGPEPTQAPQGSKVAAGANDSQATRSRAEDNGGRYLFFLHVVLEMVRDAWDGVPEWARRCFTVLFIFWIVWACISVLQGDIVSVLGWGVCRC